MGVFIRARIRSLQGFWDIYTQPVYEMILIKFINRWIVSFYYANYYSVRCGFSGLFYSLSVLFYLVKICYSIITK
jgi:hypothetical protein